MVAAEEKSETVEEKYVQTPSPVKPQIQLDDFAKLDLRVCKVLSCKAMRKANKLYKIVVHDGMGERTIVSSARRRLHADELVGRQIVVLVNLAPHKFANEVSEGMLLAAVNEDGTSKVLTAEGAEIGSDVH